MENIFTAVFEPFSGIKVKILFDIWKTEVLTISKHPLLFSLAQHLTKLWMIENMGHLFKNKVLVKQLKEMVHFCRGKQFQIYFISFFVLLSAIIKVWNGLGEEKNYIYKSDYCQHQTFWQTICIWNFWKTFWGVSFFFFNS